MTENQNTPTPDNNTGNSQGYGSYGSQAPNQGGAPQQPYGAPAAHSAPAPGEKKAKNIVGIVALGLSALGLLLGLFPMTAFFGWILLFAGFVTGIVGLFQKFKEKVTSIIAIVLSVVGTIASAIAMVLFAANTLANDPEFEQIMQDLETSVSAAATPSAVASSSAADSFSDISPDALEGILKFGETAEYGDGIKVTISEPRTDYVPSDTASVTEDEALSSYVAFTVTVENGTSGTFDPGSFYSTGSAGGREADRIFDSAQNIGSASSTTLLPGDSTTFDMAFAVADPADIVLEVSPDWEHEDIIFTNKDF